LVLQEPVLEPYGGEVFGMTIAQTTRLNAFWGTGTLIGLGTTGFLIVPRLGQFKTTRLGCILVAVCFILILLAGFTGSPPLLFATLVLFGLASGITTTGALNLILDLTAAETAGTFVGAWGLSATPVLAYSLVFCLPAFGMSIAVWVLGKVNLEEFQAEAKVAIAQILAEDLN
jgi:MFS transporter, BCD family, chlorophyll transporter